MPKKALVHKDEQVFASLREPVESTATIAAVFNFGLGYKAMIEVFFWTIFDRIIDLWLDIISP